MMIWDEVLHNLKQEISPYEFETYISPIKYDENASKSNLAVLVVQNVYIEKWVKTKYAETIAHNFEIISKTKPEIKIIVAKDKQNVKKSHMKN